MEEAGAAAARRVLTAANAKLRPCANGWSRRHEMSRGGREGERLGFSAVIGGDAIAGTRELSMGVCCRRERERVVVCGVSYRF